MRDDGHQHDRRGRSPPEDIDRRRNVLSVTMFRKPSRAKSGTVEGGLQVLYRGVDGYDQSALCRRVGQQRAGGGVGQRRQRQSPAESRRGSFVGATIVAP